MEKEIFFYALVSLIIFGVVISGTITWLFTGQKAVSKSAFECKFLDFIPSLCSEKDKKILEEDKEKQIQIREQQINAFLEKVVSAFQDCGEKSKLSLCKCSLKFSKILNSPTTISKTADGVYLENHETGFRKKIEGLTNIYINTPKNEIITVIPPYNSLFFNTDANGNLLITTGSGKDMIEINSYNNEDDMNKIAIFKQGDKKGIYIGDPESEIDCKTDCKGGYSNFAQLGKEETCTKKRCQEAANKRGLPCYYIDYWGYFSPGGTCHGDPTKSYESILEPESNKIIDIPECPTPKPLNINIV